MSVGNHIKGNIISDEAVEMAFDYLREGSDGIAAARANVLRMEYMVKAARARLTRTAPDGPVAMKEAYAISHSEYAEICERHVQAVEAWEYAYDQRNRAQLICEAWRTQSATQRSLAKVG